MRGCDPDWIVTIRQRLHKLADKCSDVCLKCAARLASAEACFVLVLECSAGEISSDWTQSCSERESGVSVEIWLEFGALLCVA